MPDELMLHLSLLHPEVVFLWGYKTSGRSIFSLCTTPVKPALSRPTFQCMSGGEQADAYPASQHGHLCFISIGNKATARSDWIDLLLKEVVKFN